MKDDLAALLAHETDDALPAEHERRIREGLGALLAAAPSAAPEAPSAEPPSAPATAGAAAGATVKLTTAVLVGLGLTAGGFVLGRATAPAAPPSAPALPALPSVALTVQTPPSVLTAAPAVSSVAPAAPASALPSPQAPSVSTGPVATGASAFDREQSLLERARSALVRHDAAGAAAALDAHDAQFPASRHAEERDYLRIQLLRERGDVAAARERARTFLATYPESLLRGRVESLAR